MVVLPFDCLAFRLRRQLKHSWLENEILRIDADRILARWKKRAWIDVLNSEFPFRLQQALELANILTDGFSPSQLVDQLVPLNNLNDNLRDKLKKAVHDTYLSATSISCLETPIRNATLALQEEFNLLRKLWIMPVNLECEELILQSWKNIHSKAKELHSLLEQLPTGVVLP